MMPLGGFDIRNLFLPSSLALLGLYVVVLLVVGVMSLSFRGSLVV